MTHTTSGSKDSVELSRLELAALRLVHRHDGAFGRVRLAEVLAGRRSPGVLEHRMEREAEFGAAEDFDAAAAALDALVKRRLLAVRGAERRRPVLALADAAQGLRRVKAGNARVPPPARMDFAQRAQLWALVRWRDLIAEQEELPKGRLASVRSLRRLVKSPPESLEALAKLGLLGEVSKRFVRTVVEVLHHRMEGPTPEEVAQTLVARLGDGQRLPLTPEVIAWGRTARGGFTKAALAAVGVTWPPPKGWREAAVGRTVSLEALRGFLIESAT
jgi:hypothetical protein